jgi:hypothetical protein
MNSRGISMISCIWLDDIFAVCVCVCAGVEDSKVGGREEGGLCVSLVD